MGVRAHLMGSTAIPGPMMFEPRDDERLELIRLTLARQFLGREPFRFRNPFTGDFVFIESGPPNWREQIMSNLNAARLAKMKVAGGMH